MPNRKLKIQSDNNNCRINFFAMGSKCEILLNPGERQVKIKQIGELISTEAWRIEDKYSRYLKNNIIHKINHSNGKPITVDDETAKLLDFASNCYNISDGLFDITTGILRQVWQFSSEQKRSAEANEVNALLPLTGWDKVSWNTPNIQLKKGMEIDFGGIGKEYAVDLCAHKLSEIYTDAFLINFGGDLFANKPQNNNTPWRVGIESPQNTQQARDSLQLSYGAITTSGNIKRFVEKDGKRFGHILNPKTGWPIEDAPLSVTVHAKTCTDAGILSTLAMLQGAAAEAFLDAQDVKYWCYR